MQPVPARARREGRGATPIIGDIDAGAMDLITIGDHVTLGGKFVVANAELVGNELIIGPVEIGDDVAVGSSCVVCLRHQDRRPCAKSPTSPRCRPERSSARPRSWDGSPGRKVGMVDRRRLAASGRRAGSRAGGGSDSIYAVMLVIVPPVSLLPIFPAFYIFDQIDDALSAWLEVPYHWYLPVLAWPTAMLMVAVTVLLIALVRWMVLPRVRSGT